MSLLLRVACSRGDPPRAREAQQFLNLWSRRSSVLTYRLASSNCDSGRTQARTAYSKTRIGYQDSEIIRSDRLPTHDNSLSHS
jgi:hypothetical protein